MIHVDITGLHQEVLHGKETAVLFGLSWSYFSETHAF